MSSGPRTDWFARDVKLEAILFWVIPATRRSVPPLFEELGRAKSSEAVIFGNNAPQRQLFGQDDRSQTDVTAEVLGAVKPSPLAVVLPASILPEDAFGVLVPALRHPDRRAQARDHSDDGRVKKLRTETGMTRRASDSCARRQVDPLNPVDRYPTLWELDVNEYE